MSHHNNLLLLIILHSQNRIQMNKSTNKIEGYYLKLNCCGFCISLHSSNIFWVFKLAGFFRVIAPFALLVVLTTPLDFATLITFIGFVLIHSLAPYPHFRRIWPNERRHFLDDFLRNIRLTDKIHIWSTCLRCRFNLAKNVNFLCCNSLKVIICLTLSDISIISITLYRLVFRR